MADELLDDAAFWLPSHFLTDDDILMDFSPSTDNGSIRSGSGFGFGSGSDTDEDELFSVFPPLSKVTSVPTSPQSTLYGYVRKDEASSRDSPNPPVSPPLSTAGGGGATTLELLNKAAGEVARLKITTEKTTTSSRGGTGFFDCSSKRQFCPPPPNPICVPTHQLPFFSPLHFPPLSHVQHQIRMRQISCQVNKIINKKNEEKNKNNRPLGLPQSAWPPLKPQTQTIHRGPHVFVGPTGHVSGKESVGTGVFLPRCVDTPVETHSKSEDGNQTKTRNGKCNKKGSKSRPASSKSTEIRLPSEWIY